MGLSAEQKSALAALLDDGTEDDVDQDDVDQAEDDVDQAEDDDETDQGASDGGEMVILRGARADSFLERFLGVTTPPPPAKKVAAKKAPAKKVAARKATPPAADPAPPKAKFF